MTHDLEEAIALSDEVILLSAGPGSRVVGRYPVDLPRPRNLIDIKTEPRFQALFSAIRNDLREEVLKSYERQNLGSCKFCSEPRYCCRGKEPPRQDYWTNSSLAAPAI